MLPSIACPTCWNAFTPPPVPRLEYGTPQTAQGWAGYKRRARARQAHHVAAHRGGDGKVGGGPRPRVTGMMRGRAISMSLDARRMLTAGSRTSEVAMRLGVHPDTVTRWLRKYPLP